jgi:hypothetical protein
VADDALPWLQDFVRLSATPLVMLLIILLFCLGSYQFALFPSEYAKCVVVERHVHMEEYLDDHAEPQGRHDIVVQDEPCFAAKLLQWPKHNTMLSASSVVKANQVKRPS